MRQEHQEHGGAWGSGDFVAEKAKALEHGRSCTECKVGAVAKSRKRITYDNHILKLRSAFKAGVLVATRGERHDAKHCGQHSDNSDCESGDFVHRCSLVGYGF